MTGQTVVSAEGSPINCVCVQWSVPDEFVSFTSLLGLWVAVLSLIVAIGGLAAGVIGPAMGVPQALRVGRRVSVEAVAVAAGVGIVVGVTNLMRLFN